MIGLIHLLFGQAQACQVPGQARPVVIGALILHGLLQLAELGNEPVKFLTIRRVHFPLQDPHPLFHADETRVIQDGQSLMIVSQRPLAQHGDDRRTGTVDGPGIRRKAARDEIEQGRFAGAVLADQTDLVCLVNSKRKTGQNLPTQKCFGKLICLNDAHDRPPWTSAILARASLNVLNWRP